MGAYLRGRAASVLLLELQGQLDPIEACQVHVPAGFDGALLVLAGSDSAAAGAAGQPGTGPPVARPAGRGSGAGVASRYVNTMPTSQLQGGGIRSAWACFKDLWLLHESLWVLTGAHQNRLHACCTGDTCWCLLLLYYRGSCISYCLAGPLPSLVLAQQWHLAPSLQQCLDLPPAQPLALRPMPGQLRLSAAIAEEEAPHLMPRLAPRLGTVKRSDHVLRESAERLHKSVSLTAFYEAPHPQCVSQLAQSLELMMTCLMWGSLPLHSK